MADKNPKVFSLLDANDLVPEITDFTSEVVHLLETIRSKYQSGPEKDRVELPESVVQEVEAALRQWSDRVIETGASPKGYFTVDFQSADPELLYCWTYGEEKIGFTHKVWENFTHRRPLAESADKPGHLRWVN